MSLLSVAEAQRRLLSLASAMPVEEIPLAETVGRWVAEDVIARRNQPAADLSAMDGYAIRYSERPGPWTIVGESAAGAGLGRALQPGEAARIFTGAPMPPGADSVLIQEEASREGSVVTMVGEGPRRIGGNVRALGTDFIQDDVLIAAGDRIDARHLALAAIGGHSKLPVSRRLRVALISTGDELVPLGEPLAVDRLPASNAMMLRGLLREWPAVVEDHGIIPDDLKAISTAFIRAAASADIVVTTGGVSVGDHDLIRPALDHAGAELDFWRVAMRPGKPLLAGRLGGAIVLGLPGNPVSSYVTACLFLRPLIAYASGAANPLPSSRLMPLGAPLPANGVRQDYLRARIEGGRAFAPDGQDSAHLVALSRADGLLVRPPNAPAARAGDMVEVIDLG